MKKLFAACLAAILLSGCNQTGEEASKSSQDAAVKVKEESKKAINDLDKKTQGLQDRVSQEVQSGEFKQKTKMAVDEVKQTIVNAQKKAEEKILQPGEQAAVEQDAYLALTEQEYDKLYQFIKINDYDGVSNMVVKNRAVELKKGSMVKVLSRKAIRAEVMSSDGQKKGFIPTSLLQPVEN